MGETGTWPSIYILHKLCNGTLPQVSQSYPHTIPSAYLSRMGVMYVSSIVVVWEYF